MDKQKIADLSILVGLCLILTRSQEEDRIEELFTEEEDQVLDELVAEVNVNHELVTDVICELINEYKNKLLAGE